MRVLITGSEGLVGSALRAELERVGHQVVRLDVKRPAGEAGRADVRDTRAVARLAGSCDGVIHLAAVSRVVWGERDPQLCRDVNVLGTARVVQAATECPSRPWVVLASSREVYGEPARLPVREDDLLAPCNIYGETKAIGEAVVLGARARGLATAVVRLSNVYGGVDDHPDRVTPAFARAAASGGVLRLDGPDHVFDFTHVSDAVCGIARVADALASGERDLPAVHLVSGVGTTLRELAAIAVEAGTAGARIDMGVQRDYDVGRFVGDPERAARLLGWRATVPVRTGVRDLVLAHARLLGAAAPTSVPSP